MTGRAAKTWPQSPLLSDDAKLVDDGRVERKTTATRIVSRCGCGRQYTARQWADLQYVGLMSDGIGDELELRNCPCSSTRAIRVPLARSAARRTPWWRRAVSRLFAARPPGCQPLPPGDSGQAAGMPTTTSR
jgi:hypothetical protein